MTRLELIIEKSYQTHSHNIHFKITGLVRRFSRRNRSSSRIHCCYIIIGTEFKLTCFVLQSSALGLKKKKCLSFFTPWEPQTSFSSSRTRDFLSTYLRINSLRSTVLSHTNISKVSKGTWVKPNFITMIYLSLCALSIDFHFLNDCISISALWTTSLFDNCPNRASPESCTWY